MTNNSTFKKTDNQDWHPADIIAALHKAGWSMRQLSLANGYKSPGTLSNAMVRPYPKAEGIIAGAIGLEPKNIWPSRYQSKKRLHKTSSDS